jgi:hypothetical protein
MEMRLLRRGYTPTSTEGELLIDGRFECYTLEDTVREGPKVYGQTAIPAGRYKVTVTHSPRFQRRLPLLHNVPNFTGIRIHVGNRPAETEGCILVGADRTTLTDAWIGRSKVAFDALLPKLEAAQARGEPMWITVEDCQHVP